MWKGVVTWSERLVSSLSRVHPLYYLAWYVASIPVFAAVYLSIPPGFYAPYARIEYAGYSDAYNSGQILQGAFRRAAQQKLAGSDGNLDASWIWNVDQLYVQRLSGGDNAIVTFDILLMGRKKSDPNWVFQIPIGVTWRPGASREIQFSTSLEDGKIFYHFDLDLRGYSDLHIPGMTTADPLAGASTEIATDFSRINVTLQEDQALRRFVAGLRGDATAVSESHWRMLYFSSIVITTVGFGDIVPITGLARALVAIEAISGILLAGLFINAIAFRASRRNDFLDDR